MKISISALSVAYGLTPEALRYYEEKGLLTPQRASSSSASFSPRRPPESALSKDASL